MPKPSPAIDFGKLEQEVGTKPQLSTVGGVVSELIKYLFPLAGLLLLLYLLFGGFQLMTSGGDPKAIQAGKSKITNALIGFVIVFVSYWLVQIVASVLGLGKVGEIFNLSL